jgi:hypothetical protein
MENKEKNVTIRGKALSQLKNEIGSEMWSL